MKNKQTNKPEYMAITWVHEPDSMAITWVQKAEQPTKTESIKTMEVTTTSPKSERK